MAAGALSLSHLWYIGVPLVGAAVGATEIIARYKDAPFQALRTLPALWYVGVNALAALFAYVLIVNFDFKFGASEQVSLVQALVASFGSMAFFRSSLFSMKVGESDVAVGPAVFFQVLLFATDRACDRRRAKPRSAEVNRIMKGVSFELAREALPNFCFELMQNIPASEQQQFRLVVDALASSTRMRDSVKTLNLGLMLMNAVGHQVLEAAVNALGEKIQGPAKLELEVFTALQRADFSKAYPLLVDIAFIMSKYGTPDEQRAAKQAVLDEIGSLTTRDDLDNGSKMTQLGLSLQQRVGDTILLAAIAHIASGIQLPVDDGQRGEQAEREVPPEPADVTDNVTPIRPGGEPPAGAGAAEAPVGAVAGGDDRQDARAGEEAGG